MSNKSNFNSNYSRRPAPAPPKLSLLGEPPIPRNPPSTSQQKTRQQPQSYGNYGYDASGNGDGGYDKSFEEEYDMMMDEFNDYHKKNEGAGSNDNYERPDRGGGGRWSQNTPAGRRRAQDFQRGGGDSSSGDGSRQRNPSWTTRVNPRDLDDEPPQRIGNSGGGGGGPGGFNQQQSFGGQNPNMNQQQQPNLQGLAGLVGQQQQNQSLLNLQSGLLGMMPLNQAQNALNLLQQQQLAAAASAANPMQLLLGNLPAFNSGVLGKQILNAAAAAAVAANGPPGGMNPFGGPAGLGTAGNRGGGMPPPLMGVRTANDGYDRNASASSSSRSRLRPRGPMPRLDRRDRSRDRKRPGDRFDAPDHKRARGHDDGRVLRKTIGSPIRGGGGNKNRDAARRKSDAEKKKREADKQKSKEKPKDDTKDKEKEKSDPDKEPAAEEKAPAAAEAIASSTDEKKESEIVDVKVKAEVEEKATADKEVKENDGKGKAKEEKDKKEKEKTKRTSKYDQIPTSLFVCKVCQKTMNDAHSFESHLSGRAHTARLDIIKQRFLKRADLLMAESRLAEDELAIEHDRQKKSGKSGGGSGKGKNHCKMCDCIYTVNWGSHKAGIHHRILKEFLHPTCHVCDAQFVHRMDWLAHITSASHLKKLGELKSAGKDLEEHESTDQSLLFTLSIEIGQDEHPSNCLTIRNLDWRVPLKDDLRELLRDDMDIPEGEIVIPEKYDETVAVGEEAIMTTVGYCCRVCRVYMTREADIEAHLKDKSHFGMYTNFLRKVVRYRAELQRREEAKARGEPEVLELDEKHMKKQIMETDENDEEKGQDDENIETGDGNGNSKEEVAAADEKVENLEQDKNESSTSAGAGDGDQDLKIGQVFSIQEGQEQEQQLENGETEKQETPMDVETLAEIVAPPADSASIPETDNGEKEEPIAENKNDEEEEQEHVIEEVLESIEPNDDANAAMTRAKSPAKSAEAPGTVKLVLERIAVTATPASKSRQTAIRGGGGGVRGRGATAKATPGGARTAATRAGGKTPAGRPGGARGGVGGITPMQRGKPGGRGGLPRADR